jgi:hypothetical protein
MVKMMTVLRLYFSAIRMELNAMDDGTLWAEMANTTAGARFGTDQLAPRAMPSMKLCMENPTNAAAPIVWLSQSRISQAWS